MCVKSCKNSSCLRTKSVLNAGAQEWRPAPHNQIPLFAPNSQPAAAPPPLQTAVPVVPLAWQLPPRLSYCNMNIPLYNLAFITYGPCTRPLPPYHSTPFSFPAAGRFYEAAPPVCGGEENYVGGPEEKMVEKRIVKSRRSYPRLWRSVRYYGVDEKAPTRRQKCRPSKLDSGAAAAGGGAALSPLCNSASKQLSGAPPSEELSSPAKTTVMIKNIPNQLRRDSMLEFLDRYCNAYSLEYDFLYLPMDFRKKDNLGYAFVNFTTAGAALKFKKILQNYRWDTVKTEKGTITSKKICEITWARIQGKEGLVKRFQNSNFACDKMDFLPVVLDPPRSGSSTEPAPPIILGRLNQPSRSL